MPTKLTQFLCSKAKLEHLSDRGFTIVESLMAMLILSIVVVGMTPPIFLAVGTRVQNRRVEQAVQLAQGEIDRVRVLVEQGDYTNYQLPEIATIPLVIPGDPIDPFVRVTGPTSAIGNKIKSAVTCPTPYTVPQIPADRAWRVDINSDCKVDFLVQIFRDPGILPANPPAGSTPPPMAFRMGVRVYAAVAEPNVANLTYERASLNFTTAQGQQRSRPLAVVYSIIARSDSAASLTRYNLLLPP